MAPAQRSAELWHEDAFLFPRQQVHGILDTTWGIKIHHDPWKRLEILLESTVSDIYIYLNIGTHICV